MRCVSVLSCFFKVESVVVLGWCERLQSAGADPLLPEDDSFSQARSTLLGKRLARRWSSEGFRKNIIPLNSRLDLSGCNDQYLSFVKGTWY